MRQPTFCSLRSSQSSSFLEPRHNLLMFTPKVLRIRIVRFAKALIMWRGHRPHLVFGKSSLTLPVLPFAISGRTANTSFPFLSAIDLRLNRLPFPRTISDFTWACSSSLTGFSLGKITWQALPPIRRIGRSLASSPFKTAIFRRSDRAPVPAQYCLFHIHPRIFSRAFKA
jgi:hypothetical protein